MSVYRLKFHAPDVHIGRLIHLVTLVYLDAIAIDKISVYCIFAILKNIFQCVLIYIGIARIEKIYPCASCMFYTLIHCFIDTFVFFRTPIVYSVNIFKDDFLCTICTTSINNNIFFVFPRL